jgi:hypothetical protein
MPACILARLASEWNSSPSRKAQPSRSAIFWPTVDLPQPETPITTTIIVIPYVQESAKRQAGMLAR